MNHIVIINSIELCIKAQQKKRYIAFYISYCNLTSRKLSILIFFLADRLFHREVVCP